MRAYLPASSHHSGTCPSRWSDDPHQSIARLAGPSEGWEVQPWHNGGTHWIRKRVVAIPYRAYCGGIHAQPAYHGSDSREASFRADLCARMRCAPDGYAHIVGLSSIVISVSGDLQIKLEPRRLQSGKSTYDDTHLVRVSWRLLNARPEPVSNDP